MFLRNSLQALSLVVFLMCLVCYIETASVADSLEDNSSRDDLRKQLQDVRAHLEKFNTHYLINLEQRMLNVLTTMTSLDSNVKTLQEKSQVWDVFQHHIGAWTEHMKSVDHKLDLIKKSQESTPHPLESKLSNLDFKIQHIFDKVDIVNEKLHDITKTVYALSSSYRARRNDRNEAHEQSAIMTKISNLQKQLNRLELNSAGCPKKNGNGNGKTKKEVQEFDDELDDFLDKITTKKLKDLAVSRKNSRSLESLSNTLRSVDERTIRIYDLEANQFEQILSCCKRTDHEITTFTNSADILLKRIERLVINVDDKIEKRNSLQCQRHNGSTSVESHLDVTTEPNEDFVIYTTENDYSISTLDLEENDIKVDFHQPDKSGCHQLTIREDGVYTFGSSELNEANRDINRRYCKFATEGAAWTVIQRREHTDLQENFNRSWNEYKNGFGDLSNEFWFGNNFIHSLTYDDNVELRIELFDFEGNSAYAEYKTFRIDTEQFNFNLMVSDYHGNASDAMSYHHDQDFSTYDHSNDKSNGLFSCALTYGSGWWFNSCAESNLNGIYYAENPSSHQSTGILWEPWLGDYSLKSTVMMIRPRDVWATDDENSSQPQDP
ncbi:angiopoietin-2-like [Aedes aegypti]|uniref:Fibrinogen C-terminal domain-containing protein n=1 Tax=Aedes aegypti TaxID=7159 RepID=A0A903VJI7_AEDAE|nr:angiopoietin-2-like [Aedes aegypti]